MFSREKGGVCFTNTSRYLFNVCNRCSYRASRVTNIAVVVCDMNNRRREKQTNHTCIYQWCERRRNCVHKWDERERRRFCASSQLQVTQSSQDTELSVSLSSVSCGRFSSSSLAWWRDIFCNSLCNLPVRSVEWVSAVTSRQSLESLQGAKRREWERQCTLSFLDSICSSRERERGRERQLCCGWC